MPLTLNVGSRSGKRPVSHLRGLSISEVVDPASNEDGARWTPGPVLSQGKLLS